MNNRNKADETSDASAAHSLMEPSIKNTWGNTNYGNNEFDINIINEAFDGRCDDFNEKWILPENDKLVYLDNGTVMLSSFDSQRNENNDSKKLSKVLNPLFMEEFEEITVTDQLSPDDVTILPEESNEHVRGIEQRSSLFTEVKLESDDRPEKEPLLQPTAMDSSDNRYRNEVYNDAETPNLYIVTLKDRTEEMVLNVEYIIFMINCTLANNELAADEYSAKLICKSPIVFKIPNVKLKYGSGVLKLVYVLAAEDVATIALQIQMYNFQVSTNNECAVRILNRISNDYEDLSEFVEMISDAKCYIDIREYINMQFDDKQEEIKHWQRLLYIKHEEHIALKRKYACLKAEAIKLKELLSAESDMKIIHNILSKYLEPEAVKFFVNQMKVSGKKGGAYRWSDQDKLFALSILYKNPTEYNILTQRYPLPTGKTLTKFVSYIKKAEENDKLMELILTNKIKLSNK